MNEQNQKTQSVGFEAVQETYRKVDKQHGRLLFGYCVAMIVFVTGIIYFDFSADSPYVGGLLQDGMVVATVISTLAMLVLLGMLLAVTYVRSSLRRLMEI